MGALRPLNTEIRYDVRIMKYMRRKNNWSVSIKKAIVILNVF